MENLSRLTKTERQKIIAQTEPKSASRLARLRVRSSLSMSAPVLLGCADNGDGPVPHSEGVIAKATPAATANRVLSTSWSSSHAIRLARDATAKITASSRLRGSAIGPGPNPLRPHVTPAAISSRTRPSQPRALPHSRAPRGVSRRCGRSPGAILRCDRHLENAAHDDAILQHVVVVAPLAG